MSLSNFHKMHTFLRVTNKFHCLVMLTYTNIRIAFLFHYFFHTKLMPKPPGLLLCALHHHYIRPPPASAAPLTRKLPTAAAGFGHPLLRYIYIYLCHIDCQKSCQIETIYASIYASKIDDIFLVMLRQCSRRLSAGVNAMVGITRSKAIKCTMLHCTRLGIEPLVKNL